MKGKYKSASCCTGSGTGNQQATTYIAEKIKYNMKELVDEIFEFMKTMILKHGTNKLPPQEWCSMVELHNKFFQTGKSCHNMNDLKQCYADMKALYHKVRSGEIVYEEQTEEEAKTYVEKTCEVCGEPMHRLAKGTKCKKCKADPSKKDIFFGEAYDKS